MKKIALLGPNLESPGGVNVVVKFLGEGFSKKEYEVHYFPVGKTKIKDNEFIHTVNSDNKKEQLKILKDKIKKYKCDIYISNNLRTNDLLSILNIKNSFYVFHQGKVLQPKNFYVRPKQRFEFSKRYNSKNLIFLNECYKNEFFKIYSYIKPKSVNIIPNPFDFDLIYKKADEFKIDGNYIVAVGRLSKEKNYEYLIKAYKLSEIEEELWFIGEGKERKNLENLVKKLNLENKIKFLRWQKNPYPFIKNAKLLCMSSIFESFSNVIVESLVLNTPVIATDIKCGPRDILRNDKYLVSLNNEKEFAKKIKEIKGMNPDVNIKRFKIENVVNKYIELFKNT